MSIYNKVSELEWYLCQKALLKEFLSKNAYEKYLSDLDRFHAEWEGLHEPKIVETDHSKEKMHETKIRRIQKKMLRKISVKLDAFPWIFFAGSYRCNE